MNRSLVLSLVLAVAIFIGMLLLFPPVWVVTTFVLLVLVTAQVVLVRRRMHVLRDWEVDEVPLPARIAKPDAGGAQAQPPPAMAKVLDRDAFSRFRSQLESAEKSLPATGNRAGPKSAEGPAITATPGAGPAGTRPVTAQPAPPAPDVAAPDEVQDRVRISSAARERPVTLEALRQPHPAEPEALEVDIFSDLRPDPHRIAKPGRPATPPVPAAAPGNDLLDVLEDSRPGATGEEGTTLLKLIEEAVARKDIEGARAGLQNYFAAMNAAPDAVDWRAHLAAMRLAALELQPARMTEAFELMLKQGYPLTEESFRSLLDELVAGMNPGDASALRVSLLVRALAVFRQHNDRPAMDRLYRRIEQAQAETGDEEKLVRFLKNHLEIKKVLQDIPGQLDLIDQIGNRLYRLGQTAAAREYYELGLKLRADQEAAGQAHEAGAGAPAAAAASPAAGEGASPATPDATPAAAPANGAKPGGRGDA